MATKKELIYNYLDMINKGLLSDDFMPSYRQMGFIIDTVRARLIKQADDRSWSRRTEFEQDLGNLNMIAVDQAECSGLVLGCNTYRTEKELPKFIRFQNKPGIIFTGSINKIDRLDLILPERVPYINFSKYTSAVPRLWYLNNHIYTNSPELLAINVRGILENPTDANGFKCGDGPCFTEDSDYPMPLDMLAVMTEYLLKVDLQSYISQLPDNTNDASNG